MSGLNPSALVAYNIILIAIIALNMPFCSYRVNENNTKIKCKTDRINCTEKI